MLLAPAVGSPPREVAERLREMIAARLGSAASRIEVAGPGFVNIFLSDGWHREATVGLLAAADSAATAAGPRERVLVEFVSANPTGPVTVAAARGAAYGDSLARLLERSGHAVEREYYLNDAGSQIELFAQSIAARMRGEEPPADGYAASTWASSPPSSSAEGTPADDLERSRAPARRRCGPGSRRRWSASASASTIWSSERELREPRRSSRRRSPSCASAGHVYESDGAVWLRTTDFGDDKDRVLIREDGEPTYFAADIAYHRDKVERG